MGRSAELVAVEAFLDASERGFATLAVEGEPGIGKTALWAESVLRARQKGAFVLLARATESEAGLALSGLGDLFGALDDALLDRLPAPQREAVRAALLREAVGETGIDERALYAGVLSTLQLLSGEGPVLLAIDDAQWLDSSSARALSFAARRLDAERIGIFATVRVWDRGVATFLDAVDPARRRALRVGPMTVAALHELIKNHLGMSLSRPVAVQVTRSSAGNPLYALEIAGTLPRSDGSARLSVPPSLGDLIAARLERLPTATRTALAVAAAASQPTTALVDPEALLPAVHEGIVAFEDDRVRFAHPLFASVVVGLLDPADRRSVHRLLAERVEEPEESARHAALAALGPDAETAARLDVAARLADRRGAPAAAAELVELALRLTPGDELGARHERTVTAARAWYAAGDLARAQELLEGADVSAGIVRARALQLLGQLHGRRSSFGEAAAASSAALAAAGDDLELRASIELDLAFCHANLGDFPGAERHAVAALDAATSAGCTGILAEALGVVTTAAVLRGGELDEEQLATALRLEDPGRRSPMQMTPSFVHGSLMMWTGRLDEALAALEQLRSRALERGEDTPIPLLDLYLVWGWLWRGDLPRASELAAEASQLAALLGDHAALGSALVCTALVHAHAGSVAEARTDAYEAMRRFAQLESPAFATWALWALGLAEVSDGNAAAAHAALGPVAEQLCRMGPVDPALAVFLPDEIEALVELGELERAEQLVSWLEERATTLRRPWALVVAPRCRALLAAAQGDDAGAFAALDGALAEHAGSDLPLDRARTLFVLGRLQRRARQRARAGATLAEALGQFERFGARRWAQRAADELEPLRVRSAHPGRLTATESRVAELAAEGLGNQAIANRAMLSVKTVEANLTRVYRKLGVTSRAALADALRAARDRAHS